MPGCRRNAGLFKISKFNIEGYISILVLDIINIDYITVNILSETYGIYYARTFY